MTVEGVNHFVSPCCRCQNCFMCYREGVSMPATHKVGEEFLDGMSSDLNGEITDPYALSMRHNLTQYLCCYHFGQVMGPLAQKWCKGDI